jgi:hypothetical protein
MSKTTNEILIDYLDGEMSPEDISEIEKKIEQDSTFASDLEYLKLAIDTVRLNAIKEKVSIVRETHPTGQPSTRQTGQGAILKMYKTALRIAAVLIFLLGSTFMYKLVTVTNQSVYNRQFIPFDLTNTRSAHNQDALADAFLNKNWNEVISIYQTGNENNNKSRFLAAMAELELNQYSKAEDLFEIILSPTSSDSSFREEAEYYLSLTYLMTHKERNGIALLNKIKADKNHPYYPLASRFSIIDREIIELKK